MRQHPTVVVGGQFFSNSIILLMPELPGQVMRLKNEVRPFLKDLPSFDCESLHYPIKVSLGNKVITCTPLLGTVDKGLYLTAKEIEELGLKQLPGFANTRHGPVKQYAANNVKISLQAGPDSTYEFPIIYETPNVNPFQSGIISASSLINHAVIFCFGKVYILDREQAVQLIEQDMITDEPFEMSQIKVIPDNDFERVIQDASVALPKADQCRTCGEASKELKSCGTCNREGNKKPALYCSPKCQKEDWNLRHKKEHEVKPKVAKTESDDLAAKVSAMKIEDESKSSKQSQDRCVTVNSMQAHIVAIVPDTFPKKGIQFIKPEMHTVCKKYPSQNVASFCCPITIASNLEQIKIDPQVDGLDDNIYLKSKVIKSLGLEKIGTIKTRYGIVNKYSGHGVKMFFQDNPQPGYKFSIICELPKNAAIPTYMNTNSCKNGIIGLSHEIFNQHALIFCFGKMYVLTKEQFATLPENIWLDEPPQIIVPQSALASASPKQSFGAVSPFFKAEKCRNCGSTGNLQVCSTCATEKNETPAKYCGQECQKKDWNARHKEEHKSKKYDVISETKGLDEISAFLKIATDGNLDEMVKALTKNPALAKAKGNIKSEIYDFKNITAFQFAIVISDDEMWELLLKIMGQAEAKSQLDELINQRKDITDKYGMHFNFRETLQEYVNTRNNTGHKQLNEKLGGAQSRWPAWLVYAFCEKGNNTAWATKDFTKKIKRDYDQNYPKALKTINPPNKPTLSLGKNYSVMRGHLDEALVFYATDQFVGMWFLETGTKRNQEIARVTHSGQAGNITRQDFDNLQKLEDIKIKKFEKLKNDLGCQQNRAPAMKMSMSQ